MWLTSKEMDAKLKGFTLFVHLYTTPKPTLMQRVRALFNR